MVTYPGANGDKWWDCSQLIEQVRSRALPIFNYLFPDAQGVFIFDCSSAHASYGPSALRVSHMNLGPGGQKNPLRDTVIPTDNPRIPAELQGQPQCMVYPPHHPHLAGKVKGVRCVLAERGLWDWYVTKSKDQKQKPVFQCANCQMSATKRDQIAREGRLRREEEAKEAYQNGGQVIPPTFEEDNQACCASKILSLQSDFANEKTLLQSVIEEAGHVCLFLPKFHCELNPIEIYWSYITDSKFPLFYFGPQSSTDCSCYQSIEKVAISVHLSRTQRLFLRRFRNLVQSQQSKSILER